MRLLLALVLVAVLALACGGDGELSPTSTAALEQGVTGIALVGPSCPVIQQDTPCPDQPFEGEIAARTLAGVEVVRTRTNADGRFTLALPPGTYDVVSLTIGVLPAPASERVTVLAGQFTEIMLLLDSGIR